MRLRILASLAFVCNLWSWPGLAAGLVTETLRLPVSVPGAFGNEQVELEALLVRPEGPGPFPLAVINHGAPRKPEERKERTAYSYLPQAKEFARRRFAALVVMRRGYGSSTGEYAESSGPCNKPDYVTSGKRSADDIRAAIRFMQQKPYIDARRVISVGQSAGGFATVALTADPPQGLVAAISFAGGRGSVSDNVVCTEERLVDAFRTFGQRSRVPMLWLYSENDKYFSPALAKAFAAAFTSAGGKAQFLSMPAFEDDGHNLFGRGIPLWTPFVDRFLEAQGLSAGAPLAVQAVSAAPPPALNEKGREAFAKFLSAPGHKAFAMSAGGGFGWRSGQRSENTAASEAVGLCENAAKRPCKLYMLNERVVE